MNEIMRRRRAMMAAQGGSAHGTWEDLFRTIDAGTYATEYAVGEVFPLDLGSTIGVVNARIVAFDADVISNTQNDKAPITLVAEFLSNNKKRMNPALSGTTGAYVVGTGTIGGWKECELRSYVASTVYDAFPSDVKTRILSVSKMSKSYDQTGAVVNNEQTDDNVWLLSQKEIRGTGDEVGVAYSAWFNSNDRRKVIPADAGVTSTVYYLRSANSTKNADGVLTSTGALGSAGSTVTGTYSYLIGFCVG